MTITESDIQTIEKKLKEDYFLVGKKSVIGLLVVILGGGYSYYETVKYKAIDYADKEVQKIIEDQGYKKKVEEIDDFYSRAQKQVNQLEQLPTLIDIINEQGEFIIETELFIVDSEKKTDYINCEAKVDDGYALVGGGVKSDSGDRPLSHSYPGVNSWKGQTYNRTNNKKMSVYAIGAKVKLQKKEQPDS